MATEEAAAEGTRQAGALADKSATGSTKLQATSNARPAVLGSSVMKKAARLVDVESGRVMEVQTNQNCIICYTANYLPADEQAHAQAGTSRNPHQKWGAVYVTILSRESSPMICFAQARPAHRVKPCCPESCPPTIHAHTWRSICC